MVKRQLLPVANSTHRMFAKKYNIPLSLPILQMIKEIKKYEKNNKIKDGLYY